MQQPTRDQPLNYLIASSYLAATFVLSLASVFIMQRRSDFSRSDAERRPSTSGMSVPSTWSQLSLLFESWTGAAHDGSTCTKQELEAFKQQMHRMIDERQKALFPLSASYCIAKQRDG